MGESDRRRVRRWANRVGVVLMLVACLAGIAASRFYESGATTLGRWSVTVALAAGSVALFGATGIALLDGKGRDAVAFACLTVAAGLGLTYTLVAEALTGRSPLVYAGFALAGLGVVIMVLFDSSSTNTPLLDQLF